MGRPADRRLFPLCQKHERGADCAYPLEEFLENNYQDFLGFYFLACSPSTPSMSPSMDPRKSCENPGT